MSSLVSACWIALESVSRLGFVGESRVTRYQLWHSGLMKDALSVRVGFFFFFFFLRFLGVYFSDSFTSSGMCLAFNQKQNCTLDQPIHTGAASSNMKHNRISLCQTLQNFGPVNLTFTAKNKTVGRA